MNVSFPNARGSNCPPTPWLGLEVGFQHLAVLWFAWNKENNIIVLFALLQFAGKTPKIQNLAHINSLLPVTCEIISRKPGSVGSPMGTAPLILTV